MTCEVGAAFLTEVGQCEQQQADDQAAAEAAGLAAAGNDDNSLSPSQAEVPATLADRADRMRRFEVRELWAAMAEEALKLGQAQAAQQLLHEYARGDARNASCCRLLEARVMLATGQRGLRVEMAASDACLQDDETPEGRIGGSERQCDVRTWCDPTLFLASAMLEAGERGEAKRVMKESLAAFRTAMFPGNVNPAHDLERAWREAEIAAEAEHATKAWLGSSASMMKSGSRSCTGTARAGGHYSSHGHHSHHNHGPAARPTPRSASACSPKISAGSSSSTAPTAATSTRRCSAATRTCRWSSATRAPLWSIASLSPCIVP